MPIDKEAILEQITATVNSYTVKKMAMELDKPYSTLSNELRHVDYAKLGFTTALAILEKALAPEVEKISQDNARKAIEMICDAFGYVCFQVPRQAKAAMTCEMKLMSNLSREYSESINQMACAIEDGKWSRDELVRCIKENKDLLTSCLAVDHFLKATLEKLHE